jgi:hypothetical protein
MMKEKNQLVLIGNNNKFQFEIWNKTFFIGLRN